MKLWWLVLAGCAVEPPAPDWGGRWSDGFHGLVVQECARKPFLALDWNHELLFAARTDAHHATASLAFLPAWSGYLILDDDQLYVEIGGLAFTATRVLGDDGDQGICPPAL